LLPALAIIIQSLFVQLMDSWMLTVVAGAINPMNLKDRLGDIQPDCRDRLHGSLL
jgi:hypothetical protein